MNDDVEGRNRKGTVYRGPSLVDAHVHFYGCYDRTTFFDRALTNFRAAASVLGIAPDPAGCLLYSESAGHHYFRRFREDADRGAGGPWTFHRTRESYSLVATRGGGEELLLVAGRQIATAERLEVLALGCDQDFPDGLAIGPTLDAVLDSDALAVLPWGFGKWWFRRGAMMDAVLGSLDPKRAFLGDNSGRPKGVPAPRHFRDAAARGVKILPGTDPLPFASEVGKAGRFGFVVDGELDRDRPGESLIELIRGQREQPREFGQLESVGRFLRNQTLMQLQKHAPARSGPSV